jgi:beta-glucanase (GH16 family)
MKRRSALTALIIGGAVLSILSGSVAASALTKDKILWTQSFGGKAGTRIDSKTWGYDLGAGGWGNSEQQYYTNKPSNISIDGLGHLVISAIKLDPESPKDQYITDWCIDCAYSSSKITTRGKLGFKYGTLEARMSIPEGVGMWPAFWMLGVPRNNCDGWPSCGEIDIMEARGSQPFYSVSSLHGTDYFGGTAKSHYYFSGNTPLTSGYHTYRVDWLQNSIKFYVDNKFVGGDTKASISPYDWAFN